MVAGILLPAVLEKPSVNWKKETTHYKSSGWAPLAYPASALVTEDSKGQESTQVNDSTYVNPLFPLDRDILTAAIRELLILDGSVDKDTLKLSADKETYRSHIDPSEWTRIRSEEIILY